MSNKIDITGYRFGRLTAITEAGRNNQGKTLWRCVCTCGRETIVRGSDLRNGKQKSCGCLRSETTRNKDIKHGGVGSRLYSIWKGMRARCNNANHSRYNDYGGRGVRLCAEWDDFTNFREWAMSHGYTDNLTIDRIDNDGNYCPENCRWATYYEQRHNRREKRCVNGI